MHDVENGKGMKFKNKFQQMIKDNFISVWVYNIKYIFNGGDLCCKYIRVTINKF